MKKTRLVFAAALLACLFVISAQAFALSYTGSLSTAYTVANPHGADGMLLGSGDWVGNSSKPAVLSWVVSLNQDNTWHYSYTLSIGQGGNPSHIIVEASENVFTASDVKNPNQTAQNFSVGLHPGSPNSSRQPNPYMPGDLYGIKFDSNSVWNQSSITVSFDSVRKPVWGDFYSKDGRSSDNGYNALWNAGFLDADPAQAISDGSIDNKVLRPDTVTATPEPGSILSLAAGCGGLLLQLRRRRK